MNYLQKLKLDKYAILLIILVGFVFSVSISAYLTTTQVVGADFYYHLELGQLLASGNFSGAWTFNLAAIKFPYGLMLFHLIVIVPIVWSGNPLLIARILEIFFMPATFALVLYLMVKKASKTAAVFTGVILFASWSFVDGCMQIRPESLDLLLYPLIVLALLSWKKKTFAVLTAITIYSHGPAAFSNVLGLGVNRLRIREWQKTILLTLLVVLPVLVVSALYIRGAWQMWGLSQTISSNPQAWEIWHAPMPFIPMYMGATMLGIPFIFRPHKTELESLLSWGIAGSLLMLPLWPDRFLQYISIPLACMAGLGMAKMKGWQQILFGILMLLAFIFYVNVFWHISYAHLWWQPVGSGQTWVTAS